ncbi:MAG: glycerol-3-phosphate acyltransferase [Gemmatimonadetes bacterium]|nr:glycerol-3-phosphate acyltransferase [Gemmatimonadota bacterium]
MSWIKEIYGHSPQLVQGIGIFLGSYILGCFTAGYYFVRLRTGKDIRQFGSGSVGARNVGRVVGPFGFALTLLVDFAKGAVAVWAAMHFTASARLAAVAMVAVVMGHIWPFQLRFRGGKGIAASLGALLVYDYSLALALLPLFVGILVLLRRTVLSGLLAFALIPLVGILMRQGALQLVALSALVALVLIAHRKNLVAEVVDLGRRRNF